MNRESNRLAYFGLTLCILLVCAGGAALDIAFHASSALTPIWTVLGSTLVISGVAVGIPSRLRLDRTRSAVEGKPSQSSVLPLATLAAVLGAIQLGLAISSGGAIRYLAVTGAFANLLVAVALYRRRPPRIRGPRSEAPA